MPESSEVTLLEIPARIADLAFRIAVPRDWNSMEPPAEEVDFSAPATFFPLLIAAAPWAAVVLTVAARPGFEDGTLQDWSLYLLDSQGIRPTSFGPATIGNVHGLAGVGRQQQDETSLEVRFAFFEDGGRLVHLGLLAPEAISASLETVWKTALQSFVLERPKGQSVPVGPSPEPSPASETPAEASPFSESEFGHYARSDDARTYDADHPVNARLREPGVGLTPNVLESNAEARTVKLGAGAIRATIGAAFGWHVIDDGQRTLVLDPAGKIQISLRVLPKEGRNIDQMLDSIEAEAAQSYANPEFLRLQDGGIWALAIRNITVDDEPVEQIHMLTAWANDRAMLCARVTSDPESMRFAANYADLILKSAEYGEALDEEVKKEEEPMEPVASNDGPEFLRRAQQLEREDRLDEAEGVLRDAIPTLDSAIVTAELYRNRWIRLRNSDPAKASEARKRAANWAYTYASWATSGGEGIALSRERDEFLQTLGPEPFESE